MKRAILTILWILAGAKLTFGAVAQPELQQLQESINQAISHVRPSVISVKAQKKRQLEGGNPGNAIWYESVGSGFVVDDQGYVLTNLHVVDGAQNINVSLWRSQQNEFSAHVVDADKSLDLALLKIESNERFEAAPMGNSDGLETGDWVICVGSPFGFKHSVSFGIVSDLHRKMVIDGTTYQDMIQTDAVINQGNSGGPLIDINGHVVGVGTAIYAPQGTYVGLGFGIPINRVKHFVSRVTGALPAAFTRAALPQTAKEPINMNKKMPNDAVHKEFSNCLECHTITQKSVVSLQAAMTHPPIAACDQCHILVKDKPVKGPVAVAAVTPMIEKPMQDRTYFELFKTVIFKLALLTLVASVLFSMMGVGGGFIYVPILLMSGVDFHTAATTSLIMLTCAQLSALVNFFKSGLVDLKLVGILEFPTMIGAFMGGLLAHHFNVNLLSIMFACVLFLASYFMMQDEVQLGTHAGGIVVTPWEWHHEFQGYEMRLDLMLATPLTFVVGYMGGMLGIACGWLKVPMMVVLFNVPMKIAVATSTLMVPITGFAGFLGHSVAGHFDWRLALPLSVITMIGAQIGSRLSIGTESNLLRFLFALVLSVVGLAMLVSMV